MKLRSHSGMNDCISQGSSRSLALYCLGSRETQREASVTLPAPSISEACNQRRDILRRLGLARDTQWIAEISDSSAERNRRAIWGLTNTFWEAAAISLGTLLSRPNAASPTPDIGK